MIGLSLFAPQGMMTQRLVNGSTAPNREAQFAAFQGGGERETLSSTRIGYCCVAAATASTTTKGQWQTMANRRRRLVLMMDGVQDVFNAVCIISAYTVKLEPSECYDVSAGHFRLQ